MRSFRFDISYFALILTIFAESSLAVRTRSRALYSEFCDNRAIRCDTSLSLTCKNQTCVCMKPENMIYDSIRGSCAALAGEKCRFTVMEEYRTWQEEIMCVSNAYCDFTQSVCKCERDFIELANGTCMPKKNYNETCETASDCKQDHSLICQFSKCVCNPATSEYNDEYQQCVGLANEPCVNDLCTSNAICREESRRTYYGSSEESEEEYGETHRDPASVGRCQCRTAFGVTTDGRCQLGYGGKCDHHTEKCMDWFKCKEGTCVCRYPTHQIYDRNSESCLSYVGGPCTKPGTADMSGQNNKSKIDCIEGAVCTKAGDSSRYHCTCPPGFIENSERSCDLDFDQICSSVSSSRQISSSSSASSANCDRIGKLFCIDGRCQCEDDLHVYDKPSRSCKGLVGATCNAKQKGECIPGSYCHVRRGSATSSSSSTEDTEGICLCQEFYREGEDRTCSPKAQQQQPTHITLKSGGSDTGNGVEKFNSTANSIWAIFDHNEDD